MKPISRLIFAIFLCLVQLNLQAQNKTEIFVQKLDDCGCKWGDNSPNIETLKDCITETFGNNEVVNELIKNIADSPTEIIKKNIEKWVGTTMKKDKNEAWESLRDSLKTSSVAMIEEMKEDDKLKANLICDISKKLHLYYLGHLEEIGENAAQRKFYESLSPTPAPQDTTHNIQSTIVETNTADAAATEGAIPITMILLVLALLAAGGFGYLWYSERAKHQKHLQSLSDTQVELYSLKKNKEEKGNFFETEKTRLEQEIQQLKNKVETQQREIQELIYLQNKGKDANEGIKTPPPSLNIERYLFAPSQDGTFYQNSIKETQGSDTFYTLTLSHENDAEASFSLIKDPDLLNRAEAMAQEYLLSACDLQGKGKININSLQITPGRVKREGGGWKIIKKVVLRW